MRIKGAAARRSTTTNRPRQQADRQQRHRGARRSRDGHRQRIRRQGQRQRQRPGVVEPHPLLHPPIRRQVTPHQPAVEQSQRHVDQEDRRPPRLRDQQPAQRRPQRSADGRHRAQQPHRPAGLRLGHRIAHQCRRQCQHHRRAEPLHRPRRDQPPQSGRQRATQRRGGEQADADQHQATPPDQVTEATCADDQRGDRQQVSEDDPLHLRERGAEGGRQRRQAGIGDAGVQGRHQHGQGKAGQGPAGGTV